MYYIYERDNNMTTQTSLVRASSQLARRYGKDKSIYLETLTQLFLRGKERLESEETYSIDCVRKPPSSLLNLVTLLTRMGAAPNNFSPFGLCKHRSTAYDAIQEVCVEIPGEVSREIRDLLRELGSNYRQQHPVTTDEGITPLHIAIFTEDYVGITLVHRYSDDWIRPMQAGSTIYTLPGDLLFQNATTTQTKNSKLCLRAAVAVYKRIVDTENLNSFIKQDVQDFLSSACTFLGWCKEKVDPEKVFYDVIYAKASDAMRVRTTIQIVELLEYDSFEHELKASFDMVSSVFCGGVRNPINGQYVSMDSTNFLQASGVLTGIFQLKLTEPLGLHKIKNLFRGDELYTYLYLCGVLSSDRHCEKLEDFMGECYRRLITKN